MIFYLILALAIALIAVIFALGNTGPVTISFLAWHLEEQPLALVLLIAVAAGVLIGVLIMTPNSIKQKMALSGEKKKHKATEKSLEERKGEVDSLTVKEEERQKSLEEKRAKILAEAKGLDEAENAG